MEPAPADTKPEEADDSLELLFPRERFVLPGLAPLDQILRVEVTQEGDVALLGEAQELRLKDVPEFLHGGRGEVAGFGVSEVSGDGLLHSRQSLNSLYILTTQRFVLELAGDEFGLLPGTWFWRRRKIVLDGRGACH